MITDTCPECVDATNRIDMQALTFAKVCNLPMVQLALYACGHGVLPSHFHMQWPCACCPCTALINEMSQ